MRRTLALSLAVLASCSFAAMRSPDPVGTHRADIEPDCSSGNVAPTLDVLAAILSYASAVFAYTLFSGLDETGDSGGEVALLALPPVAVGAVFTASAARGFSVSSECKAVRERWLSQQVPTEAWPGAEGGACRATMPRCELGLACASKLCVRPPPGIGVPTEGETMTRHLDQDRRTEVATQLAIAAKQAAFAGDCQKVRGLEGKVRVLDREIHARLVEQPRVQQCLVSVDPPSAPPTDPPPAP